MGRFSSKQVSKESRGAIIALANEGFSSREIAARVPCCQKSVSNILRLHRETNSVNVKERSGRPSQISKRVSRKLCKLSRNSRFMSSKNLSVELEQSTGVKISARSVRRHLFNSGLKGRRPATKPLLSRTHRLKRLQFCKRYEKWTIENWKTVIFSDESPFNIFGNRGALKVRRSVGERYKPECVLSSVKHPLTVNVWGCFSLNGTGRLEVLEVGERMNAAWYQKVLENRMLPQALQWYPNGTFKFQDDGAPCHRAKTILKWHRDHHVDIFDDWPPQSPDINPIENLWGIIGQSVSKSKPTTRPQLIAAIIKAWFREIDQSMLENLISSMPSRLKAIIKNKGFHSKY